MAVLPEHQCRLHPVLGMQYSLLCGTVFHFYKHTQFARLTGDAAPKTKSLASFSREG